MLSREIPVAHMIRPNGKQICYGTMYHSLKSSCSITWLRCDPANRFNYPYRMFVCWASHSNSLLPPFSIFPLMDIMIYWARLYMCVVKGRCHLSFVFLFPFLFQKCIVLQTLLFPQADASVMFPLILFQLDSCHNLIPKTFVREGDANIAEKCCKWTY